MFCPQFAVSKAGETDLMHDASPCPIRKSILIDVLSLLKLTYSLHYASQCVYRAVEALKPVKLPYRVGAESDHCFVCSAGSRLTPEAFDVTPIGDMQYDFGDKPT